MYEKKCGSCGAMVPTSITVGDNCPSCGARFFTESTAPGSSGGSSGLSLKTILIIVFILLAVGAAMFMRTIPKMKKNKTNTEQSRDNQ